MATPKLRVRRAVGTIALPRRGCFSTARRHRRNKIALADREVYRFPEFAVIIVAVGDSHKGLEFVQGLSLLNQPFDKLLT